MHNVDVRNVSLGQIMYFTNVAETLNVSRSAEYFHLSQPALSKKIASLEQQLDLQLFIRTNRIEALTPAGEHLYEKWKNMVSQMEESIQQAHVLQTGRTKSLVIACMDSYKPDLFLVPLIEKFSEKHPEIFIRVETAGVQDIRRMLQQNEADIIFSILYDFEDRDSDEIICRSYGETTHCARMTKENPLAQKEYLQVSDLQFSNFICISPQVLPEYVKMLHALCQPYGFVPNITNYVSSANSLALNIHSPNELFICDRYYLDINDREHVIVPIRDTASSIIMAWRKENPKKYLRDFIDLANRFHPQDI